VSGIGDVQGAFVQNFKKLSDYYAALDTGHLPIERGYVLDEDDRLRRHVITELMCNAHIDIREVEQRFGIVFAERFAPELAELTRPGSAADDGLVVVTPSAIDLSTLGRFFVRNVCMVFDRYLGARATSARPVFSRTV
jgi:oxygen-independent coproporphyrinogen-3 oxidase